MPRDKAKLSQHKEEAKAKAEAEEKAKKEAEEKLKSFSSDQEELAKAIYKDIKKHKESEKYFNLTLIDSGFYSFTPKKSNGSDYKEKVLVDFVTEEVFVSSGSTEICNTLELTQTAEFDHKKDSKFTFLLKSSQEDLDKVKTKRSVNITLDTDRQKLIDDIEKLDPTNITNALQESPLKAYNQEYQEYLKAESEVELALTKRFEDFKNSLFLLKTTKPDSPAPAGEGAGGASAAAPDAGGAGGGPAAGAGGGGDAGEGAAGDGGGGVAGPAEGGAGGGVGDGGGVDMEKIKSKCQSQKDELTKKIQDFKKDLAEIDRSPLRKDLKDKIDAYDDFLDKVDKVLATEGDEKLEDTSRLEKTNIAELVDYVKSMETLVIAEYEKIEKGKQKNSTYLAQIANYITQLITSYDTNSKEGKKDGEEEKKDEEESELLKALSDLLKNIREKSEEEVESEGTKAKEPKEGSELNELQKYFTDFTSAAERAGAEEGEEEEEEEGGEEEGVESATTKKITKEELKIFKENFTKLKTIFSNTISSYSYSSEEEKTKITEILQQIFETTDKTLKDLESLILEEEKLEAFLDQYDKEDSKDEQSKEKLQEAIENLTSKKAKFDTTKSNFFPSDKDRDEVIVDHTIDELKYRYAQALSSSSALKLAIDQLLKTKDSDKKDWQQALDPALFSDLETKFPVTDFLTIKDEIALITAPPTEELRGKITAEKKSSQGPVKLSDESKEITKAIEEIYNEDKEIKRHSWQGEKIFKLDNALQIPLAVDFSADSCFTVEERTLQKPSDPNYKPKEKEFYQLQDGLLYKASKSASEKSNNKYLQAVTDDEELKRINNYLSYETSLAKAANKKFQLIKNQSSGYITLLRSDFIDKKYVKDDNYQKQYIKATCEDISLWDKEHKKSEFGSIHFIEQSEKNSEQNYIFGKCDISYSSFRGCKFENVDFTLMDKKVFGSLKFINCQFLNCKIPQSVNKAFASINIAQKEIKVPARTIEKATVSALLASSKSPSTP